MIIRIGNLDPALLGLSLVCFALTAAAGYVLLMGW